MSLHEDSYYDSPSIYRYKIRDLIPEDKRCVQCEGLGLMRVRHSQTGRDWAICLECYGTGKVIS